MKDIKIDLIMNNLIFLVNSFIHASKWRKIKLLFSIFKRELVDSHLSSLKLMKGKHAKSLLRAYEELKIYDDL